ncbi:hypothetical protein EV284_3539 [Streptomyces sp. BK022]|nr:hypothetical protein EV284_3539 [Streptomyces sp. BK022]
MGAFRLWRYIEHSIGLDPQAERDMEDMECTGCDWTANGGGEGLTFDQIQEAALKHAGATGHRGFRQTTTNYWLVVRHDQDVASQLSVPAVPTPTSLRRDGLPLRGADPPV